MCYGGQSAQIRANTTRRIHLVIVIEGVITANVLGDFATEVVYTRLDMSMASKYSVLSSL